MSGSIQECSQSPSLTVIGIAPIPVTIGRCVPLAQALL